MRLSEILTKKKIATATVATLATVTHEIVPSVATVASVAVANTRIVKTETLKDRQREASRQKAIGLMNESPGTPRGIYVDDQIDPDNIVVFVAVRSCMRTCELTIPRERYDPFALLALIERMDISGADGERQSEQPNRVSARL